MKAWEGSTKLITWPLRNAQLFGHCAPPNYLATAHRPIFYSVSCDGLCYEWSGYYPWNNILMLAVLTVMLFQIMQRNLPTLYQLTNTILSASTHWHGGYQEKWKWKLQWLFKQDGSYFCSLSFTCLISVIGYGKLTLRKHGGGALKCYLGINLRSKTSWQNPVQNLITAPCTKPHDITVYKTSWQHPVQNLMTSPCKKPHDSTLYKTSWHHPVKNLMTAPCTKPHDSTLYKTSWQHPVQNSTSGLSPSMNNTRWDIWVP